MTPEKLTKAIPDVNPQAVQAVMSGLYRSGFISKEKDGFRVTQRGSKRHFETTPIGNGFN